MKNTLNPVSYIKRFYSSDVNMLFKRFIKLVDNVEDLSRHSLRNYNDFRECKKELKGFMDELKDELHHYSLDKLMEILRLCSSIHHICNSTKFDAILIDTIIEKSKNYIGTFVDRKLLNDDPSFNKYDGDHLSNLISVIGYKGGLNVFSTDEYLYTTLSSSLSKYDIYQLLCLVDAVLFVYNRLKLERYKILLQRCIMSIFNIIEQSNPNLTCKHIVLMLKSLSVFNDVTMIKRINQLIINRTKNIIIDDDNLNDILNRHYKITKGNIHIMYTLILNGLVDDYNVIEVLLRSIIDYCIFYFNSTSMIKKYEGENKMLDEYSVDPNTLKILYSKYPNKLFKVAPKSNIKLGTDIKYCKDIIINSSIKDVIKGSLNRLLINDKYTFCRSLKLSQIYLQLFHQNIYYNLSDDVKDYFDAVKSFKFKDRFYKSIIDSQIDKLFTKFGYKPINIMINDIYPIKCLSLDKKLFIEIFNGKQSRLSVHRNSSSACIKGHYPMTNLPINSMTSSKFIYNDEETDILLNKSSSIKLHYLKSLGWTVKVFYVNHWLKLSNKQRINYIRNLLNTC